MTDGDGRAVYSPPVQQRRARRVLAVYLLVVGLLTLVPALGPDVTDLFVDVARALGAHHSEGTTALVDATTNVVLYVPIGLLLTDVVPRLRPPGVWLLCVAASATVEFVQIFVPGRTASLLDVGANALGAAIGVLIAQLVRRRAAAR